MFEIVFFKHYYPLQAHNSLSTSVMLFLKKIKNKTSQLHWTNNSQKLFLPSPKSHTNLARPSSNLLLQVRWSSFVGEEKGSNTLPYRIANKHLISKLRISLSGCINYLLRRQKNKFLFIHNINKYIWDNNTHHPYPRNLALTLLGGNILLPLTFYRRRSGVQRGNDGLKCTETTLESRSSTIGVKLTHLGTLYWLIEAPLEIA